MLDRLRGRLNALFLSLGRGAALLIPSPTAWTLIGLALAGVSASAYSLSGLMNEQLGGLVLLLSGFLDIVDGAVARATLRTTKIGGFLDSTLDRVGELVVYIGILAGGYAPPVLVMYAAGMSLLVSYARAKGDALGVSLAGVGVGERSERLLVLVIASLLGYVFYGVAIVAIIATATFLERLYRLASALG